MTKARFISGLLAIIVGCLVNYAADRLIGVRLEMVPLNDPLAIFNVKWAILIFIIPVFVGLATASVFGLGGKWLCYFPPVIVRTIAYLESYSMANLPEGITLMPFGWWIFFVILAVECSAIGGVFGEIMIKRIYGRTSREDAEKLYIKSGEKNREASSSE
ncbi:MAG: hypothetical protein L0Z73_14970 [Gammaproteobacteria bacterium]|nr:hypothetical protein [Gammaproteobacteria bacterium]